MRPRSSLALAALLVLAACGDDMPSPGGVAATGSAVPTWAKVSKEQVAEADKLKIPVAFENSIGMRLVLIPAGKFTMGSPPTEDSREDDETAHEVTLTKAYYVQTTELTNRQYRKFKADHHCLEQLAGYSIDGDEQPVNQISWNDAVAFVGWLNGQQPGHGYRLPTEAEWERACRAGTSTPYWWGASITPDRAYYEMKVDPIDRSARVTTVPVGTFPVSPWGLYEIHGNVREWCADWYDDLDYPVGPATDPLGPPPGDSHVVRGGGDGDSPHMLRAAFRIGLGGDDESRSYIGVRVAASALTK